MTAFQPVDTTIRAFRPVPITDDEAAAMFRAVVNLFGKWDVTDEQASTLLDVPVRSYRRWKADGEPGRIDRDGKARLSNLIGIHKALRYMFRETRRTRIRSVSSPPSMISSAERSWNALLGALIQS